MQADRQTVHRPDTNGLIIRPFPSCPKGMLCKWLCTLWMADEPKRHSVVFANPSSSCRRLDLNLRAPFNTISIRQCYCSGASQNTFTRGNNTDRPRSVSGGITGANDDHVQLPPIIIIHRLRALTRCERALIQPRWQNIDGLVGGPRGGLIRRRPPTLRCVALGENPPTMWWPFARHLLLLCAVVVKFLLNNIKRLI